MAISRRHEMPQQSTVFCEVFYVWGIDFMGLVPISQGNYYILLAIDYISRWVEAKATKANDAKTIKALINDQGSHFCNCLMAMLLKKYGVVYRVATAYQPQTNGQAEECLPIKLSPKRLDTCRLRLNTEPTGQLRSATWPTTKPTKKGNCKKLCLEAYENSQIYKEKVKQFHDSRILRKEFKVGQKVLLFNSRLKLIAGKLRSRWDGLSVVTNVFPYGAIKVRDEANNRNLKVNRHHLKPYYEGPKLSSNAGENSSPVTNNSDSLEYNSTKNFAKLEQIENNDKTLNELATPDVVYQPWCIQYPQLEPDQTYELKFGFIHLLLKFHGLAGENPHKHLKEFHVVCSIMRPQGIPEDYIKMKAFSFSLDGPILFNTWGDMKCIFVEKFFPTSRTTTIKKEIYGIMQHPGETLHKYWERFNKLCTTCPHHQISEQLLIQYFYEGLSMMDRSMIDAASGRASMDKTPAATRRMIYNLASNTQQFRIRGPSQAQMVNEIGVASDQRLENQLTKLASLVRQLAVGQHQPTIAAKVCGICTFVEHPIDLYPTLQETELDQPENIGAIGGYQYGKQPYQS
ncbi:Pol polyprotein, partial [Mucuna pruriens]